MATFPRACTEPSSCPSAATWCLLLLHGAQALPSPLLCQLLLSPLRAVLLPDFPAHQAKITLVVPAPTCSQLNSPPCYAILAGLSARLSVCFPVFSLYTLCVFKCNLSAFATLPNFTLVSLPCVTSRVVVEIFGDILGY